MKRPSTSMRIPKPKKLLKAYNCFMIIFLDSALVGHILHNTEYRN